jgi:SNF2 family DNA or RNA helicase
MRALWKHQATEIAMAETMPDRGLFFEMGTGKSRTIVEILRRKFAREKRVMRTLILCPIKVCQNWKDEFQLYSKINPKDLIVLTKSGKLRVRDLINALGEQLTHNKVIITNYEALQMQDIYKLLTHWIPEIIVADEAQRLKNPQGTRAKLLAPLADMADHRYILTGTPILNSPMDIFMQFRILDKGETFGKNFFAFRASYFVDINDRWKGKQGYFPKWQASEARFAELHQKISAKSSRVLKKDCLDLPPLTRKIVAVELSPVQRRMYKEMRDDFIAFIESHKNEPSTVVAQLAITKALRLQQIVSGFAKDDNGKIHRLPCPRLTALEEILETITPSNKVIVWCVFKENYVMIQELCKKLGLAYREIHGGISTKECLDGMHDFRTLPEVKVMIANQSAGGTGINLIEAAYSVYYSKNFSLEQDLQSEARNYRGGSEMHANVTRIDLVAEDTIDVLVSEALANKQSISDKILSWKV